MPANQSTGASSSSKALEWARRMLFEAPKTAFYASALTALGIKLSAKALGVKQLQDARNPDNSVNTDPLEEVVTQAINIKEGNKQKKAIICGGGVEQPQDQDKINESIKQELGVPIPKFNEVK